MKTRYTLNETAEILGISRASLYKKYLDKGVLSRQRDSNNKLYIDASEIARAFPDADFEGKNKNKSDISKASEAVEISQQKTLLIEEKEREIKRLHDELRWHKEQIEMLNARLEHKPVQQEKRSNEGLFKRIARAVLDE